jgi:hypothetical protein
MDDEVLAGFAPLVGVVDACVHERVFDPRPVDRHRRLIGVLLDNREQITEETLFDRRQLGPLDGPGARFRLVDLVDRLPLGGDEGAAARRGAGMATRGPSAAAAPVAARV